MSDKIPDALMGIGLTDMLSTSSGKDPYTYRMAPTPSFTAGVNKYGKHAELKSLLAAHESEERNIMMLPEEIEEINELLKQAVPSVQNAGDDGGDANGKTVCGVWSSFNKADVDLAQEMLDKIGYETSREQDYDEDDNGEDKMLYMLLVSHKIDA